MADPDAPVPPPRTTVRIPTPSGDELDAWFYEPVGHGPQSDTRQSSDLRTRHRPSQNSRLGWFVKMPTRSIAKRTSAQRPDNAMAGAPRARRR
jgi:hypothetical protein